MRQFVSKYLCIKLHKLGFHKPSRFFYEWIGATEMDESKTPFWYIDGVTVYTANQIKRELPKNIAINENVVEFGIQETDSLADRRAKVLIRLIEDDVLVSRFIQRKGA